MSQARRSSSMRKWSAKARWSIRSILDPGDHVITARPANPERASLKLEVRRAARGRAREVSALLSGIGIDDQRRAMERKRCRAEAPRSRASVLEPRNVVPIALGGLTAISSGVALAFTIKASAADGAATEWATRTGGNCDVPSPGLLRARRGSRAAQRRQPDRQRDLDRRRRVRRRHGGDHPLLAEVELIRLASAGLRIAPRCRHARGARDGDLRMSQLSVVATYKIVIGAGAALAVMSAAGCGATESTCSELQRTCGCDNRKPCSGDGAAGKGGAGDGRYRREGAAPAAGADGGDSETDAGIDAGVGGKGGAAGSDGSGGFGRNVGSGGKGGAAGAGRDSR